ncbi:Phox homologous domain-containing protein [Pyronema domesticum]|uniref:Similar to Vacuolar morphogenesis protein 7 homolog acc. no. O74509 n=1 Tax=Pyronema omphalodes (strain CBS 100304) TaxID=1076935 RepID=U4LQE6_PYROM|nr:Phox homologous domain-containing protein [Pyronema domesticum]CCX34381.1 Similar to Vacuolar morphogenesis protein 7 homolog; acc. no. O74509 [Pyronema omphalodes CBS 100304]
MSLTLTIPTTSETPPPRSYTLYHILLRTSVRSYSLPKRYSDFLTLHSALTTACHAAPPLSPPPKHYLFSTLGSPSRTEERRAGLEAYLYAIINHTDSRWRDSAVWRSFLSLPASWINNSKTPQQQLYSPVSGGPITDPALWVDSHRELKTLLHQSRTSIQTAQEKGEGWQDAKRLLMKAGGLIAALEQGLNEQGEKEKPLLDGEMRRRRDLVAAAKQDRDALETLATMLSSSKNSAAKNTAAGGDKPPASRFQGTRVLGAPIPETQATRELDNKGVLQLQEQVLKEQDKGIGELLRIVERQRAMGTAITQELELQVEMLKEMEKDVDRVDKKTRGARRKAEGIS